LDMGAVHADLIGGVRRVPTHLAPFEGRRGAPNKKPDLAGVLCEGCQDRLETLWLALFEGCQLAIFEGCQKRLYIRELAPFGSA
jgi:hypothetical protein